LTSPFKPSMRSLLSARSLEYKCQWVCHLRHGLELFIPFSFSIAINAVLIVLYGPLFSNCPAQPLVATHLDTFGTSDATRTLGPHGPASVTCVRRSQA
jgi:hypothetical protein